MLFMGDMAPMFYVKRKRLGFVGLVTGIDRNGTPGQLGKKKKSIYFSTIARSNG
jgi:hypothetical protein